MHPIHVASVDGTRPDRFASSHAAGCHLRYIGFGGCFLALSLAGLATPVNHKFDFGPGAVADGYVAVIADTIYTPDRGHGFEPGTAIAGIDRGGDALQGDFCTGERPFFFSVDLPEGDYRVRLLLGDRAGESQTVVKAESRRLVLEKVVTKSGGVSAATFLVHIRTPQIPGGGQVRLKPREIGALHWDKRLTLEFNGARPCLAALEITKVEDAVTVFLAGDSTVTDQQLEPYAAWGQMLPAFFGPTVAVANHAESGESIRSFVGERRLDKVLSLIKPGDYLLLQFGHNDQKAGPEHLGAATGYKDMVRRYVADVRAKGAHPVLVTSMERRNFDGEGKRIVPSLDGYPQAIREAGGELGVPVIDLNARSIPFYEALGPEGARRAFVHFPANSYPGQDRALADDTHFSAYGAYELAKCVVEEIKAHAPALAAHLRPGLPAFDPAHPDAFADWRLPASPPKPVVKPEGS
jgi:lysophospholipase L1-like esterase